MKAGAIRLRVISLKGSARRERVAQALARVALPWSFFDASNGSQSAIPYDPSAAEALWGRPLSAGEIGCFASHVGVLREFVEEGDGSWLLVMEDDVTLDPAFPFGRLAELGEASGVDYFRLYGRYLIRFRHVGWFCDRQIVRFRGKPLGTQAYLISRAGARSFLDSVERIERPVDHEIDRAWANGLDCYSVYPHPAFELSSPTSVDKRGILAGRPVGDRIRTFAWRVEERLRREWHELAARRSDLRLRQALALMQESPPEPAIREVVTPG